MAGDWIKWRRDLVSLPEVIRMSKILINNEEFRDWLNPGRGALSNGQIIGEYPLRCVTAALLGVTWSASREHGEFDGDDLILDGLDPKDIDSIPQAPGFGAAMLGVGWLIHEEKEQRLRLPNFKKYNVPLSGAERQARYRSRVTGSDEPRVTFPLPEKRREEKMMSSDVSSETSSSPNGDATVSGSKEETKETTFQDHMDFYNLEVAPKLPGCPRIEKLTENRKIAMRGRLTDFPDLWTRIIDEAGRLGQFAHDKRFIDFDFLMRPASLQKFLEGKYRRKDITYGQVSTPTTTRRTPGIFEFGTETDKRPRTANSKTPHDTG